MFRWIVTLLWVLLLSGCGVPRSTDQFFGTPEAQFAQSAVRQLASGDVAAVEALLDDRIRQPQVGDEIRRVAAMLPTTEPTHVEPVDWRFFQQASLSEGGPSTRTTRVAIEYTFASGPSTAPAARWVVATVTLSGEAGAFRLLGLHVEPLSAPLSELNALSLKGKGALHCVFAALAIASAALCVFAFIRCLRTKGLKRKWLWCLLTLVGVCSISLSWEQGSVSVQLLYLGFFGAGLSRVGWLGPWTMSIMIPIGAIIFLVRERLSTLPVEKHA